MHSRSRRASLGLAVLAAGFLCPAMVATTFAADPPTAQGTSVGTSDLTAAAGKKAFMIVGAPTTNDSRGAAIVFERDDKGAWKQLKKFAISSQLLAQFGTSVSMSLDGTVALVGAPGDGSTVVTPGVVGSGKAYFLKNKDGKWQQSTVVLIPTLPRGSGLGTTVHVTPDGTKAFIAAPSANDEKGVVYYFNINADGVAYKDSEIVSPEPGPYQFGSSISSSKNGDWVVIGDRINSGGKGAAWVFSRVNGKYTDVKKVVAEGGSGTDQAQGFSVSMNWAGDALVMGAPQENNGIGSAFVFARDSSNNWVQKAQLKDPSSASSQNFGMTVSMAGDGVGTIAVGEPYASGGSSDQLGKVFTFTKANKSWTYSAKPALTNAKCNELGKSIVIAQNGTFLVAGAPSSRNSSDVYTGATCYFEKAGKGSESGWKQKGKPIIAK